MAITQICNHFPGQHECMWCRCVPSHEDGALIDAVVNAHVGVAMKEHHALTLLVTLGMDGDEAEELLADARHEASKP